MRLLAVCACLLAAPADGQSLAAEDGTTRLVIDRPVSRYGHAIMGDVPEWSRLCLSRGGEAACVTLRGDAIFEDMEARLVDIDGDGLAEAMVVESTPSDGAALAFYDLDGGALTRLATPAIGTRNRWLAPVGAADLDGDGRIEVAYVDRPHLARILRIWRHEAGTLREVASLAGVTNHRIGEETLASAVRDCGDGPELILTDAASRRILAVTMDVTLAGDALRSRDLGRYRGAVSIARAAACR